MVFSQTSHKTQSILKVVEIDRLRPEKSLADGSNGSNGKTDGLSEVILPGVLPATASYSQDYLKPEPAFESTMFRETDCEFFQDLVGWCSDPAKEELLTTTDSPKLVEDRAFNTDTLHTPFSPHGWDGLDANSPAAQASFYTTTPKDPLSPVDGTVGLDKFSFNLDMEGDRSLQMQELSLDIGSLPVVVEELASGRLVDAAPWHAAGMPAWGSSDYYTKPITNVHATVPYLNIDQEDSLDMKYMTSVTPREVEVGGDVISEYIVKEASSAGLRLDVAAHTPVWPSDIISTPEVLSYVEQLEATQYPHPNTVAAQKKQTTHVAFDATEKHPVSPPVVIDYEPITPKSECHMESEEDTLPRSSGRRRRRRDSEDSDETYWPHRECFTPRKYKRKKPDVPIKDMIMALKGSQNLHKARRGRPPKRPRDSTASSVCSMDENSSVSTQENKYRELRDKNNEASKRSRMNRKLKELQMEQMADDLEETNKKLKVKADVLEEMTKKLKDALMMSFLQK